MAVRLSELIEYAKPKYKMSMICGENNMDNIIEWVHMLEDPETADFLKGQELIFTTGIGQDNTDWFIEFVKGLVRNNACGLVLNIGPYIKAVPEELKKYCAEIEFLLFTIPWETRIVDISNDFCHRIINAEKNEVTVAGAFKNAIFFPDKDSDYRSVLERRSFDMDAEYSVMAISLNTETYEKQIAHANRTRLDLTKILYRYSNRFSIINYDNILLVVMQNFSRKDIEDALNDLRVGTLNKENIEKMHVGISAADFGVLSLPRSFRRANSVLRIAKKKKIEQLHYEDIGINQLIIEVEDMKVLKKFYDDRLGELENYDQKNDTDYMELLKLYLDKNNSVEKVAAEMFVHRNTVNYKIKKIKEILSSELNHQDVLDLLLAYRIKEYL